MSVPSVSQLCGWGLHDAMGYSCDIVPLVDPFAAVPDAPAELIARHRHEAIPVKPPLEEDFLPLSLRSVVFAGRHHWSYARNGLVALVVVSGAPAVELEQGDALGQGLRHVQPNWQIVWP